MRVRPGGEERNRNREKVFIGATLATHTDGKSKRRKSERVLHVVNSKLLTSVENNRRHSGRSGRDHRALHCPNTTASVYTHAHAHAHAHTFVFLLL